MGKIAAQQQFPLRRESLAIEEIGADLVETTAEELVDFQLAVGELGPDTIQKGMDLVLGQSHNTRGDLDGTLIAHETKGPGEHMSAVGVQGDGAAGYVDWLHLVMGTAIPVRLIPLAVSVSAASPLATAERPASIPPPGFR